MAEDVRYFQFLAGPRNGEVVVFDKIEEEDGMVFICFKDGSRCNEQLIVPLNDTNYTNQLMAEVDGPTNLWSIKEEWVGRKEEKWVWLDETNPGLPEEKVCVQAFEPGKKKITPVPPRPTKSKFGQISAFNTPVPQTNVSSVFGTKTSQTTPSKPEQSNFGDPVWMMCEKARKFDQEIIMTLRVSLPKKDLYNVAKESFEDGGTKVIEYIIHSLDDKLIKESLRQALLEAYDPIWKDPSSDLPYEVEAPIISGPRAAKGGKELQDFIEDSAAEKGLK
jgi:hypothetical protein